MLLLRGLLGFALLALWIYCIVDVITRDRSECRNLPKLAWLAIVVFLPEIGSLLWLIAGRPRGPQPAQSRINGRFPEYDRPGRQPATNPDDDEAFLRGLKERAEQQRRAAERQRREAERRATEDEERGD